MFLHRKATWSLKLSIEEELNQKCIHNQNDNIQLVLARFEPVQNAFGNAICEWKVLCLILNHGKKTENQMTANAENNVLIICIANILVRIIKVLYTVQRKVTPENEIINVGQTYKKFTASY